VTEASTGDFSMVLIKSKYTTETKKIEIPDLVAETDQLVVQYLYTCEATSCPYLFGIL
jgi:hypothetical protein